MIKSSTVLRQTIMVYDHEKVPQIYLYGGQNLSKITAFSQEILVKDVCVRRKSTIKSHPDGIQKNRVEKWETIK